MTADDKAHRVDLQRLAFGRADSPAEKARADEALRQLQAAEAAAIRAASDAKDAESHAAEGAATDAGRSDSVSADEPAGMAPIHGFVEPNSPPRLLQRAPRWLIPVVAVGLVVIGAIGGAAASGSASDSAARPSAAPTSHPAVVPFAERDWSADPQAAERWFNGERTAADELPYPVADLGSGSSIDPATARLVMQVPGEFPWNLWVARTSAGGYCLYMAYPSDGTSDYICKTSEVFAASGLEFFSSPGAQVRWDGSRLSIYDEK